MARSLALPAAAVPEGAPPTAPVPAHPGSIRLVVVKAAPLSSLVRATKRAASRTDLVTTWCCCSARPISKMPNRNGIRMKNRKSENSTAAVPETARIKPREKPATDRIPIIIARPCTLDSPLRTMVDPALSAKRRATSCGRSGRRRERDCPMSHHPIRRGLRRKEKFSLHSVEVWAR